MKTSKYGMIIIRHAEASSNFKGLVGGINSDPLTKNGIAEAKALGNFLVNSLKVNPKRVFTSNMLRAIETYAHFNYKTEPIKCCELDETNCGLVSSWKRKKFDTLYADFWNQFDPGRNFPGGESHTEMYDRVIRKFNFILNSAEYGTTDMLVVHSGTISSILHKIYSIPLTLYSRFETKNASITFLEFDHLNKLPKLRFFNLLHNFNSEES